METLGYIDSAPIAPLGVRCGTAAYETRDRHAANRRVNGARSTLEGFAL